MVCALALLPISGCDDSERERPAPPPEGYYGINGVVLRAWSAQGRQALVDQHLDAIEESGIEFVRAQLGWQQLEPEAPTAGRHAYDFTDADAWVAALARHRLRWYVFGVGIPTPDWAAIEGLPAACRTRSPPRRAADFAAAMAAIARRYAHDGAFWSEHPELPRVPPVDYEVWNAPNHGGDWCPQPDPAAYAALYATTRAAVRAADPRARAVIGGLGAFPETRIGASGAAEIETGQFLELLLAEMPSLRGAIDAVGVHVYAGDAEEALASLRDVAARLEDVGLGDVPISWNEVGWPTRGVGATPEDLRAGYIGELASTDLRGCGVLTFAPHTWVTEQRDPANPEDWFGIADPVTAEGYPSAGAYANGIARGRSGKVPEGPCG